MILAESAGTKWSSLLLIVFAFRGFLYYTTRRAILRDFDRIEYLKIAITVLEMATILTAEVGTLTPLVILTISTVVLQLVHSTSVVFRSIKHATFSDTQFSKSDGVLPYKGHFNEQA